MQYSAGYHIMVGIGMRLLPVEFNGKIMMLEAFLQKSGKGEFQYQRSVSAKVQCMGSLLPFQ
jgi:hypothetical protein